MSAIFDIIFIHKPAFKVSIYYCDEDIKEKWPPMNLDGIYGQAYGGMLRVRTLGEIAACAHFELFYCFIDSCLLSSRELFKWRHVGIIYRPENPLLHFSNTNRRPGCFMEPGAEAVPEIYGPRVVAF